MATTFTSNKVIRVVRNPIDVFPSYANMLNTLSHANKTEFNLSVEYADWWDWFVRKQTVYMKRMLDILFKHTHDQKKNPMYIVRYEDLVNKPREAMLGLFSFILEKEDLEGTNAMRRVEACVAAGQKATQSYELKNTTGRLNVNWNLFTEEQIEFIKDTLGDHLWYLGYAKHPTEANPTGFFEFKNPSEEQLAKHNQFERDNIKMRKVFH